MAKLTLRPNIALNLQLTLNEAEANALYALTLYGNESFLKAFKKDLGSCYIESHEAGLIELFNSVRRIIPSLLSRVKEARSVFDGQKTAIRNGTEND